MLIVGQGRRLSHHEWHYQGQVGHGAWVAESAGFSVKPTWSKNGMPASSKKTKDVSTLWLEASMQQYFVRQCSSPVTIEDKEPASTWFQVMRLKEDDGSSLWWWDQAIGARGKCRGASIGAGECDNVELPVQVTIALAFPREIEIKFYHSSDGAGCWIRFAGLPPRTGPLPSGMARNWAKRLIS